MLYDFQMVPDASFQKCTHACALSKIPFNVSQQRKMNHITNYCFRQLKIYNLFNRNPLKQAPINIAPIFKMSICRGHSQGNTNGIFARLLAHISLPAAYSQSILHFSFPPACLHFIRISPIFFIFRQQHFYLFQYFPLSTD